MAPSITIPTVLLSIATISGAQIYIPSESCPTVKPKNDFSEKDVSKELLELPMIENI